MFKWTDFEKSGTPCPNTYIVSCKEEEMTTHRLSVLLAAIIINWRDDEEEGK